MKIYKVKVNGKTYTVELESVTEGSGSLKKEEKKQEAAPAQVTTGEGQPVISPIQGTVVSIKVSVGQTVKKGDVIAVIEAMKLENDVVSTCDGEVSAILITKGQTVSAKQNLILVK